MKKLYKFYWNCGRSGNVKGMFIADEKEVEQAIGNEVSFGEILGKHSDIYGTLEDGEITEVVVSESTLEEMEEVLGRNISGYNPLDYIKYECERCGECLDASECEWFLDTEENIICEECVTEEESGSLTQL